MSLKTTTLQYAEQVLRVLQEQTDRMLIVDILAKLGWDANVQNASKVNMGLRHLTWGGHVQGTKEGGWAVARILEQEAGTCSLGEIGSIQWSHGTVSAPYPQARVLVQFAPGAGWPAQLPLPARWVGALPVAQSTRNKVQAMVSRGTSVVHALVESTLHQELRQEAPRVHEAPLPQEEKAPTPRAAPTTLPPSVRSLGLLSALREEPGTLRELAQRTHLSYNNVFGQLKRLATRGLVVVRETEKGKVYHPGQGTGGTHLSTFEEQAQERWLIREETILRALKGDRVASSKEILAFCIQEGVPMERYVFYQTLVRLRKANFIDGKPHGPYMRTKVARNTAAE